MGDLDLRNARAAVREGPAPPQPEILPLTPGRIRREALLTGISIFAISAAALVVTYQVARHSLLLQIRSNLGDLAGYAATTLDTRQDGGVIAPGPPASAGYRRATEPLLRLRRTVPDLYYAYTLVPSPAGFRFGVDSSAFIRNPGDDTPVAQPGELYADAPPASWRAFRSGRVAVSTSPYTDRWGTFISGFAPLRDGSGRTVGLVGVDLSLADLQGYLRPLRLTLLLALSASAALAAAAALSRWRSLRAQAAAIREIAQASRAKSSFLATMSHELRTPLNGVIGLTDILLGTPLTSSQQECVLTMKGSGEKLLLLLSDLLDVSRLESGALEVEFASCRLAPLLEEEVGRLRSQAEGKGILLELHLAHDLPETVVTDGPRLRQILRQLLGNAIKYTSQGTIAVSAAQRPSSRNAPAALEIAVHDTGPGLAPAVQERLFQPFAQADSSSTRTHEGTGLGLALSLGLAKALGGTITADSAAGQGCTFRLRLPLTTPVQPAADDPPSGAVEASAALDGSMAGSIAERHPLRILVAEDNVVNARVCQLMLQRLGYQASLARDGEEAVQAQASLDPDLILMDLRMPGLDGLEATRRIRMRHGAEGSQNRRPWIIAMTANTLASDHAAALDSGMDDFLAKPMLLDSLSSALCRAHTALQRGQ